MTRFCGCCGRRRLLPGWGDGIYWCWPCWRHVLPPAGVDVTADLLRPVRARLSPSGHPVTLSRSQPLRRTPLTRQPSREDSPRRVPTRAAALQRGNGLTRKNPLRGRSEARRRAQPERDRVRAAVFQRDGYRCRAVELIPHIVCGGQLDAHEVIPRSAWAAGWLVEDNVVAICRRHHEFVTDNPERAHALGLHGYSWERER